MTDITGILSQIESGDPSAADQLLPLVYDELRKLAAAKLAHEKPGQTLQATALVHEAYIRLVGSGDPEPSWDSRAHFFAAAAEAMRRVLVDTARRKRGVKHGGARARQPLDESQLATPKLGDDILALNEALNRLADTDYQAAELVKLRYFAGLTSEQAAELLAVSPRTADRIWVYARSFLLRELENS